MLPLFRKGAGGRATRPRATGTVPSAAGRKVGLCNEAGSYYGVKPELGVIFSAEGREAAQMVHSVCTGVGKGWCWALEAKREMRRIPVWSQM